MKEADIWLLTGLISAILSIVLFLSGTSSQKISIMILLDGIAWACIIKAIRLAKKEESS